MAEKEKVLVTGGTGFLGSYLIRQLLDEGFHVRALKRKSSKTHLLGDAVDKVEWVEGDVLDVPGIEDALQGIDKVYHSAAVISFAPSERKWMFKINIEGTANMINLSLDAGVKKFCQVSSVSSLGRYEMKGKIDESREWKKHKHNTNYSISKYLSEMEVWRGQAEGLSTVIVNPATILGAGNWESGSCAIFGKIGDGLKFYTSGLNGFVDVRDVADITIKLMESDIEGERFVIMEDNYRFKDIFFMIADAMNKPRPALAANPLFTAIAWRTEWLKSKLTGKQAIITRETARYTQMDYEYDNSKVKEALNYKFRPIEETIKEVAPLYLESVKAGKSYAIF